MHAGVVEENLHGTEMLDRAGIERVDLVPARASVGSVSPPPLSLAAAASSAAGSMSASTTRMPAAVKASHSAKPMPLAAPVTTATLSASSSTRLN
jgi:hypothetical protein